LDPVTLVSCFALGCLLGAVFMWFRSNASIRDSLKTIQTLESSNNSLSVIDNERQIEVQQLKAELSTALVAHAKAETLWEQAVLRNKELEASGQRAAAAIEETSQKLHRAEANAQSEAAKVQVLRDQFSETQKTKEEMKVLAKNEFQVLAQTILEEKAKVFDTQSGNRLGELIRPFKEQIDLFSRSIDEKYSNESKERFSLQNQIRLVVEAQHKLSTEANGLSKALRGDSKIQGDWGETVLERILESAGLLEGRDYSSQLNAKDGEGKDQRPDVVVNLPGDRKLIVDAKVSLKAYSSLPDAASEEEREALQKEHVASVRRHVADLSARHYQRLDGIHSPDFVFMFIPVEPAYLAAAQFDQNLVTEAWQRKVAIVSSTTLFSSMQVVASLWRLENQNQNAQRIAQEAAGLYDQFARFAESFEKVGKSLDGAKDAYNQGLLRLSSGKGNVVRRIEALRRLGVAPTKKLSAPLLAASGDEDDTTSEVPEVADSIESSNNQISKEE
jgi:DNA recombination protein RmuC